MQHTSTLILLTCEAEPPQALLNEMKPLLLLEGLALQRVRLASDDDDRNPDVLLEDSLPQTGRTFALVVVIVPAGVLPLCCPTRPEPSHRDQSFPHRIP